MSAPSRLAGAVLSCALVVVTAAFSAPARPAGEPSAACGPESALIVRLLHAARRPTPPPLEEAAPSLAVLAPEELPLLFAILESERVPAQDGEPEQVLSRAQRALVVAALERAGNAEIHTWAVGQLAGQDGARQRAAALWMLGAVGRASDQPQGFERALLDAEPDLDERVGAALRAALASVVRRDPGAIEQLERSWRDLPEELLRTLLFSLGDGRRGDAMLLVADVLGTRPELAALILSQVRRLGPPTTLEEGRRLARVVRPYLDSRNPTSCQAAVQALSELEDVESIPYMIELLHEEEEILREVAGWGLQRVTGLELAPAASVWSAWYEGELDWYERDWPKLRGRLNALQIDRIASTVQEMTQHGLFRHELSLDLARALSNPHPSVRTCACVALGELRSPVGIPWLLDRIDDRRPEVSAAAAAAIQRITGIAPPIVPSLWGELLARSGYEL